MYVIYKKVDEYFAVVGGLPCVSLDVHMGYYNKQNGCVKGEFGEYGGILRGFLAQGRRGAKEGIRLNYCIRVIRAALR